MSRFLHYTIAVSLLGAAISTTARSAGAQQSDASAATRVRVAVVPSIPVSTASAMVVRTDDQLPLIVLDARHADPETLDMALALVAKLRTVPLSAGQQQVVPIQGGVAPRGTSAARTAFLRAQLRRLQTRPTGRIGSLGMGQYIELTDERTTTRLGRA